MITAPSGRVTAVTMSSLGFAFLWARLGPRREMCLTGVLYTHWHVLCELWKYGIILSYIDDVIVFFCPLVVGNLGIWEFTSCLYTVSSKTYKPRYTIYINCSKHWRLDSVTKNISSINTDPRPHCEGLTSLLLDRVMSCVLLYMITYSNEDKEFWMEQERRKNELKRQRKQSMDWFISGKLSKRGINPPKSLVKIETQVIY